MPNKNDELDRDQPKANDANPAKAKSSEKAPVKPVANVKPVAKLSGENHSAPLKTAAIIGDAEVAGHEPNTASAEASTAARRAQRRRRTKTLAARGIAGVVVLAAITLLVFGVLIYVYKSESPVVAAVAKVVPYPAEKVNGNFVSYGSYLFEVDANKRAYANNAKLNNQPAVDYASADGKKMVKEIKQHALDKLKSDAVVAQLAAQKKVSVSDKEVNDLINQLYQRYGGKDTLLKTLSQIYGWNINDLKHVVRGQLLAKKLQDKVTSDPAVDGQAKAKAKDVDAKAKAGDFAAVAKQYSQASDAASGGDLGSFTKGQLPDEVQKAVDALQPGGVSDPVKTQYGYEIIKVTDKTGDTTKASHILIKTIDFNDYFNGELKKAKVSTYIKVS